MRYGPARLFPQFCEHLVEKSESGAVVLLIEVLQNFIVRFLHPFRLGAGRLLEYSSPAIARIPPNVHDAQLDVRFDGQRFGRGREALLQRRRGREDIKSGKD